MKIAHPFIVTCTGSNSHKSCTRTSTYSTLRYELWKLEYGEKNYDEAGAVSVAHLHYGYRTRVRIDQKHRLEANKLSLTTALRVLYCDSVFRLSPLLPFLDLTSAF